MDGGCREVCTRCSAANGGSHDDGEERRTEVGGRDGGASRRRPRWRIGQEKRRPRWRRRLWATKGEEDGGERPWLQLGAGREEDEDHTRRTCEVAEHSSAAQQWLRTGDWVRVMEGCRG